MNHLKATFPISERRAARVVSVSRSTLRYEARLPDDESRLLARMEVLVRKHPRYGKWLSLVDEYTRECPTLLCNRSITAADVIDELIRLMKTRGVPAHIRSDNGPEFIAKAIRTWLREGRSRHPLRGARRPVGERLRRILPRPPPG